MGTKNRLIQLVVQCEKHTQHEEHVLSRGSGESLMGKICKFSFLRSNLALIFYSVNAIPQGTCENQYINGSQKHV